MTERDAQEAWDEYYRRIRKRRVNEAHQLWPRMVADGVTNKTFLVFDFRHFGNDVGGISDLSTQLGENYHVEVRRRDDREDYWLVEGTTRPKGVDGLDLDRLVAWVEFLCDVAQSHSCVFSMWRLSDEARSRAWTSESCTD